MTSPDVSPDAPPDSAHDFFRSILAALHGWRAAALVALVHAAVALLAFDPAPQVGGDNAAYRALAQALASGRGYVRLWEPGHAPETLYPPLFPALLSIPVRLGMDHWSALNLFMVPLSVGYAMASWLLARRLVPALPALAIALVVALSPGLADLSHAVLSDIPFAALGAVALWALCGIGAAAPAGEPADHRPEARLAVVAVGGTVLAYLTRSAALPLAVTALGWLAWRRRWLPAAALVALLGPIALLWTGRARATGRSAYSDFLTMVDPYQPALGRMHGVAWLARVWENLQRYATTHLPVLLFGTANRVTAVVACIVLGLALAGWVMRARRPDPTIAWLPMYLGLLLIWPATWSAERYLLPAYPVLLALAWHTVAAALARHRVRLLQPLLVAGALGTAAMLYADVDRALTAADCRGSGVGAVEGCLDPAWQSWFTAARATRGRLPAGSVVLSRKPTLMYSESGYASLTYPFSRARDTLFTAAHAAGARYLLLDDFPIAVQFVNDVVREEPGRFCVLPALSGEGAVMMRFEEHPVAAGPAAGMAVRIRECAPE